MSTRMSQASAVFKDLLNEQPHLANDIVPLQTSYPQMYPTFTQQIQPQHLQYNPTRTTHPTLNQQPQYNNTQHTYQPKKAGIVNKIINTINNQHQKILESVILSQENTTKFQYQCSQIERRCNNINYIEEQIRELWGNMKKQFDKKLSIIRDTINQAKNNEIWIKIITEQQNKISSLLYFISNYLNGKDNNLKDAFTKIMGCSSFDLKEYKLEDSVELNTLNELASDKNVETIMSSEEPIKLNKLKMKNVTANTELKCENNNSNEFIETNNNDDNLIKNDFELISPELKLKKSSIKEPPTKSLAKEKDTSELLKTPAESNGIKIQIEPESTEIIIEKSIKNLSNDTEKIEKEKIEIMNFESKSKSISSNKIKPLNINAKNATNARKKKDKINKKYKHNNKKKKKKRISNHQAKKNNNNNNKKTNKINIKNYQNYLPNWVIEEKKKTEKIRKDKRSPSQERSFMSWYTYELCNKPKEKSIITINKLDTIEKQRAYYFDNEKHLQSTFTML